MDTLSSEEYFAQLNGAMDTVEALINQTTVLPIGWQDEWSSIPCCGKDSVKVAPKAPKSGKPVTAVVSQKEPSCFIWGLWKFIGLAITWGAIFLGGPYWFDIVKRLVTWRRTLSTPLNPQQGQQK